MIKIRIKCARAIKNAYLPSIFLLFASLPVFTSAEQVTIYRDAFGTPHIYGDSAEAAVFAMGYAQAQDRLEELLKNYLKAEGRMAEVFGPEWFKHDVKQRMWRHAAKSKELYSTKPAKIRAITEAYQAGIKRYMRENPTKVPAWAPRIEPWQVSALGRLIIWGWPEGEAAGDLRREGIEFDLGQYEYHGSNQWLIAPNRTADGAVMALIDPHLSWYGHFRFYESRLYGGELAYSGMGILGLPLATLGHSAYCSVAMTTGGPDTADVYRETVNPNDPLQYFYDGAWRDMEVVREIIGVLDNGQMRYQEAFFHYTHHGPIVARQGQYAYAMAIPYFDEIYHLDQIYGMNTARNLDEMKVALGMLQYMAQNIMIGTVDGDIYYVRNGRVPVRPSGFDFTRPVDGSTSASEWRGLHELGDLVQIQNPSQGYMQNNNVSPFAMMKDSPLVPERYASYLYNADRTPPHQRAAMTLEHLATDDSVTVGEGMEIALSTQVYGAGAWQQRMNEAWRRLDIDINADVDATILRALISEWNGHSTKDSIGATAYKYWKDAIPEEIRKNDRFGGPPDPSFTDQQVIESLRTAATNLRLEHNNLQVPYGSIYRVGRQPGERDWPVGGGNPGSGMATPRNIGFGERRADGTYLGQSGQTSTQVVLLTKPPQSWTYLPLGESDDPNSPHYDDQARLLFSERRLKPTYFMNRDDLLKHIESSLELTFTAN